eukprot:4889775-Pleurochrysis_carterae.AAC.1
MSGCPEALTSGGGVIGAAVKPSSGESPIGGVPGDVIGVCVSSTGGVRIENRVTLKEESCSKGSSLLAREHCGARAAPSAVEAAFKRETDDTPVGVCWCASLCAG